MQKEGIQISAFGMINCLGRRSDMIYPALIAGAQDNFSIKADLIPDRQVIVGAVAGDLEPLPAQYDGISVPSAQLAIEAYRQIETVVSEKINRFGRDRVALVIGTSTAGITVGEAAFRHQLSAGSFPSDYRYDLQEPGAVSSILADVIGIAGPAYTISTACSSGARALCSARNLLEAGVCDAVVCGGADALSCLSLNGFSSLELLSGSVCNPFSRSRSGITLGEGACLFLCTREEGGLRLLGVGESSDAYHFSAPDPEGVAVAKAVKQALGEANLGADAIAYINLHGTGTLQNDLMESRIVNKLFGSEVPCSSTKPLVGHTLGAAGAIEAGFCCMVLDQARDKIVLPPHCWDGEKDDQLPELRFAEKGDAIEAKGQVAMLSNSFAFGGNNCVILIGKDFG